MGGTLSIADTKSQLESKKQNEASNVKKHSLYELLSHSGNGLDRGQVYLQVQMQASLK
jgi:hypothetical protein